MVYRLLGRLLTFADAVVLVIVLFAFHFSREMVLLGATYLIVKGTFFMLVSKDIVSVFDVLVGTYLILLAVGVHLTLVTVLSVLFLGQKVIMGML